MQQNSFWRYKKMLSFAPKYKSYFILDFEATCQKNTQIHPQEIIEFPCLMIDSQNFTLISKFHRYVKPTVHPVLTTYCTDLTGITQETVDQADEFPVVLEDFKIWLKENFDDSGKSIFVTCGNWDLKTMLPNQCKLNGLEAPEQTKEWINLKTAFFQATGFYPRSLNEMAFRVNISLTGRLHSGIDDCKNIVSIMRTLGEKKFVFNETDNLI